MYEVDVCSQSLAHKHGTRSALPISLISYSDKKSIRMERINPPPELDIESLHLMDEWKEWQEHGSCTEYRAVVRTTMIRCK